MGEFSAANRVCAAVLDSEEESFRLPESTFAELVMIAATTYSLAHGADETMGDYFKELMTSCVDFISYSENYERTYLPRYRGALESLAAALELGSYELLFESADTLSQTWPAYTDSIYPNLFTGISEKYHLKSPDSFPGKNFALTSYASWTKGLRAALGGDLETAMKLLSLSRAIYERTKYLGDASWLYTDVAIIELLMGNVEAAEATIEAQRVYVHTAERDMSDSERMRHGVSRYLRVSEHLYTFYVGRRIADFKAAIDIFAYNWSSYQASPYVQIFRELRLKVMAEFSGDPYSGAHVTASSLWSDSFSALQLGTAPSRVKPMLAEVKERLESIGYHEDAATCRLDSILIDAMYEGGKRKERLLRDLRESSKGAESQLFQYETALRDLVNILLREESKHSQMEGAFIRLFATRPRSACTDILTVVASWLSRPSQARAPLYEIALSNDSLFVNGILVTSSLSKASFRTMECLVQSHISARGQHVPVERVADYAGISVKSVPQVVRRLREVIEKRVTAVTGFRLDASELIVSKPGYRLNEALVLSARQVSSELGEILGSARIPAALPDNVVMIPVRESDRLRYS